jgi:hypothetical protein
MTYTKGPFAAEATAPSRVQGGSAAAGPFIEIR